MTEDSQFNISEMELLVTSLYIIYDTPKYDIIWTERSYVIDSCISEILKYESSVIVSSTVELSRTNYTDTYAMQATLRRLKKLLIYCCILILERLKKV